MSNETQDSFSSRHAAQMNSVYDDLFRDFSDVVSRNDFYGFVGEMTVGQFSSTLGLSRNSRVLDLCCGIGGPARYLARRYGCTVTGVDLSAANLLTAKKRTCEAGLSDRVAFIEGDVLTAKIENGAYSHVFGCDAWFYFADKVPLYKLAHRALVPGGIIAFLDQSAEAPIRFTYENYIGGVHFESRASYETQLRAAEFESVEIQDLTDVARRDAAQVVMKAIGERQRLIALSPEIYTIYLEVQAEGLASLCCGRTSYCGCVARKVQ